jgi:AraC-like DNA-binding protein
MNLHTADNASIRFSTDDMPERDRAAMLREQFGRRVFRLDVAPLPDVAFRFAVRTHALPGVVISSSAGGGMRAWRTRELVSDARDGYLLVINLKGPSVLAQRGREFVVEEHAATVMTLDEVGGITRPTLDHRLLTLQMPPAAIAPLLRHSGDAIMRPIPRGSVPLRLLINYIAALEREAGLTAPLRPIVGHHIHDLVAATIGAVPDAMETARGRGIRAARLATFRADVLAHLSEARLSAKTVGRRHGVSDRYVQMLFAETGETFSCFVEKARLQRAFALLTDPTSSIRQIGRIAAAVGFAEHSTFSRAFRRRFGDTPSGVRRNRTDDDAD